MMSSLQRQSWHGDFFAYTVLTATALLPLISPLQDTVGEWSWLQTQMTHYEGVTGLTEAYPGHFEAATGGHVTAEHVSLRWLLLPASSSCMHAPLVLGNEAELQPMYCHS